MPCEKCLTHKTDYSDFIMNKGIIADGDCIFHASKENKTIELSQFNDLIFEYIDSKIKSGIDKVDFVEVVFPGTISFTRYNSENVFEPFLEFSNCTFIDESFFINSHFRRVVRFLDVKFNKTPYFIKTIFESGVGFNRCVFGDKAIFSDTSFDQFSIFTLCEAKENCLIMNHMRAKSIINLMFTSYEVDSFSFQQCEFPDALHYERIISKDEIGAFYLYQSLKRKAVKEQDQQTVSWWHYREKRVKLKQVLLRDSGALQIFDNIESGSFCFLCRAWLVIQLVAKTPRLLLYLDFWYWLLSGFGERDHRALSWLMLLLILPLLLNVILPQIDSFPCSDLINSTLNYIPFTKELPGHSGWLRLGQGLSQLLITIQAAIYAFALRNRFRR